MMSKEQNLTKGLLCPEVPVMVRSPFSDTICHHCPYALCSPHWKYIEPGMSEMRTFLRSLALTLSPAGHTLPQLTLICQLFFLKVYVQHSLFFSLPELPMKITIPPTLSLYVYFCLTYSCNCSIFNMLLMSIYIKINHSILKNFSLYHRT